MTDKSIGLVTGIKPIVTNILQGKSLTGREQDFYAIARQASEKLGMQILGFAQSKVLDEFVVCLFEDGQTILRLQSSVNKYVIYQTRNPEKLYTRFYKII